MADTAWAKERARQIGYHLSRPGTVCECADCGASRDVLARLRDPDEAMTEAVGTYLVNSPTEVSVTWDSLHPEIREGYADEARGVCRALADHLSSPPAPTLVCTCSYHFTQQHAPDCPCFGRGPGLSSPPKEEG